MHFQLKCLSQFPNPCSDSEIEEKVVEFLFRVHQIKKVRTRKDIPMTT